MPTYGYRCTECGHTFERLQKMTDPAVTVCESCGGAVKKMLYPVGISFKGSGFYVNDYSKNSGPTKTDKTESGDGTPATAATPDTAAKSEVKPESPAPSAPAATTTETKPAPPAAPPSK